MAGLEWENNGDRQSSMWSVIGRFGILSDKGTTIVDFTVKATAIKITTGSRWYTDLMYNASDKEICISIESPMSVPTPATSNN